MWTESFKSILKQTGTLDSTILKGDILPYATRAYERASIVMAIRLAATSRDFNQHFIFSVTPPCEYMVSGISAGLLLADFVYKKAPERVIHHRKGPLLSGDVLIITHAVGNTIDRLKEIRFGGDSLQNHWFIGSYSKYYPSHGTARVFAANPGWILEGVPERRISALIIDATHPRTLSKLPQILAKTQNVPFQLIVTYPLPKSDLSNLGYPEKSKLWLWDPEAKNSVEEVISGRKLNPYSTSRRSFWICSAPDLDDALSEVNSILYACITSEEKQAPALWEAWSLLQRFRQLSVPLAQVEDFTFQVWGALSFGKRLERLENEWPENFSVEVRWPKIIQGLQRIYDLLKSLKEPEKFWALAERADHYICESYKSLRVVTPTEYEATILNINLDNIVDGWLDSQKNGFEVISVKEEARRVSEGDFKPTILLGARTGKFKYLDIYPQCQTEIMSYPYEAEIDQVQQKRNYDFLETFQQLQNRAEIFSALGIPCKNGSTYCISCRPEIVVAGCLEPRSRKSDIVTVEPGIFNIDHLAGSGINPSWDEDPHIELEVKAGEHQSREKNICITYSGGLTIDYMDRQFLDVYHPSLGQIHRYRASDLKPGMHVVMLVDGLYENLYDRLIEAIKAKIGAHAKLILSLWDQAKMITFRNYRSKKELHRILKTKGVSVDYVTMLAWFRNDRFSDQLELDLGLEESRLKETIAPREYDNMKILADQSGVYPNEPMIRATFKVIQEERVRRRKAGHALHNLLRAIATGEGYERSLASARELGSDITDVLGAVEIKEIKSIQFSGKN